MSSQLCSISKLVVDVIKVVVAISLIVVDVSFFVANVSVLVDDVIPRGHFIPRDVLPGGLISIPPCSRVPCGNHVPFRIPSCDLSV